jgi:hypothetical protein
MCTCLFLDDNGGKGFLIACPFVWGGSTFSSNVLCNSHLQQVGLSSSEMGYVISIERVEEQATSWQQGCANLQKFCQIGVGGK